MRKRKEEREFTQNWRAIWYKSSIHKQLSPCGAKIGAGSPFCKRMCEKSVELFKNSVCIFLSAAHNFFKPFKESGGFLCVKGENSLRQHCIKSYNSSAADITTRTRDH